MNASSEHGGLVVNGMSDQARDSGYANSAIVAAVGATAIVLWRKAKKKVGKVLKIDPNANKEVEEEIVLTESDEASQESND